METVHAVLEGLSEIVDIVGLSIVLIGAAKFVVSYARIELRRLGGRQCTEELQSARRMLGSYILVGLEFMIVSDIISTVVSRSLEALAYLAGIVLLRTVIGYFLQQELASHAEAEANGT